MLGDRNIRRVLILRPGSLGDTVAALPCLHLVARLFPDAERCLLSTLPGSTRAVSARAVLDGSALVTEYMEVEYAAARYWLGEQMALRRRIRECKPQVLVYLTDPKSLPRTLAEAAFFWSCGIPRLVGVPLRKELRQHLWNPRAGRYEHEAERLARCVAPLGDARPQDRANWDLRLTAKEQERATKLVQAWPGREQFIALAVGARVEVKDWGLGNWQALAARLAPKYRDYGLAMIGAVDEFDLAQRVSALWAGPTLNLCGRVSPRECAAVLQSAALFVGHDGGAMHLATSAGTRCVAVFSGHHKPGVWFPYGEGHRVLYHQTPCYGCLLDTCERFNKQCIRSITVGEVAAAVEAALAERRPETRMARNAAAG